MPRAKTSSDVFNAIAEPKRRQIIDLLARHRGVAVGTMVLSLGLPQPAVSKHLSVLRQVGLVSVSKQGQSRVYDLNYERLKPVHDWVKTFEQHWNHQLHRIRSRAEKRALAQKSGRSEMSSQPPSRRSETTNDHEEKP